MSFFQKKLRSSLGVSVDTLTGVTSYYAATAVVSFEIAIFGITTAPAIAVIIAVVTISYVIDAGLDYIIEKTTGYNPRD